MKKFLKGVQGIQDDCISRTKANKENPLLTKVGGATIRSVKEGVTFDEWKKIAENQNGNLKDWRRFNTDKDKVIIEKNFLLNSIQMTKFYFLFRPYNDEGDTYIQINDTFHSKIPKEKQHIFLVYLFAMMFVLFLLAISLYFLFAFLLIIPVIIYDDWVEKKYRKEKMVWESYLSSQPQQLLGQDEPCSYLSQEHDRQIRTNVKISLDSSYFKDNYVKMLDELTNSCQKLNGRIVWLYNYCPVMIGISDAFKFVCHFDDLAREIMRFKIEVNNMSSNLIPAIETEHSFIFFLDHYSDQMEQALGTNDLLLKMVESRTKNQNGNVKYDDLFVPNWNL